MERPSPEYRILRLRHNRYLPNSESQYTTSKRIRRKRSELKDIRVTSTFSEMLRKE